MVRSRATGVAIASVVALTVLGGCNSDPSPTRAAPDWILDLHPVLAMDFDLVPESQVAVLEDGDLTFDEFEAATLAAIACTNDQGYPLRGPVTYDEKAHLFDYSISGGATAAGGKAAADALNECYDAHVGYLANLWQWLHQPSVSERQAATAAMSECLTAGGVESFPPPDTPQFREWHRSQPGHGSIASGVSDCLNVVQSRFGFLPGQHGPDSP